MTPARIDIATGGGEPIIAELVRMPGTTAEDESRFLAEPDRRRAQRISNPVRRRQFVTGRRLLGELLSTRGDDWTIALAPSGRPEARCDGRRLAVSISHSGPWVAVAIGRVAGLGIDIEISPRQRNFRLLARRMHWPAGDRREFLRRWALWEAAGKSRGLGALRGHDEVFEALIERLADGDAVGPVQAGDHGALLLPIAEDHGWLGLVALETTLGNMRFAQQAVGRVPTSC